MEDSYTNQFMQEVHNNMQMAERPKQKKLKKAFAIIGIILFLAALTVGGIHTINHVMENRQLARFRDDEAALVKNTEEVLSDPIFSIVPYYDDENGFYVDAWGMDDEIIVKILPYCDPDHYDEYAQKARDWLSDGISDISQYTIVIDRCENSR